MAEYPPKERVSNGSQRDAEIKMQMAKDIVCSMIASGAEKKMDKPVEKSCIIAEKIFNRFHGEQ